MEENNQSMQYQDCNLESMKALLIELFEQEVSNESKLQELCSDDVNKLDVIKNGISQRFGVCVTIEDIVKSNNVTDFTEFVIKQINSPRFPVNEKDLRKAQLSEIAKDGNIQTFVGDIENAGIQLKKSLEKIERIKAPIEEIPKRWLGRVTQSDIEKVVIKLDENTHIAVNNLGDAIGWTNKWIDKICEMLIWIIQIENDIYGLTEESSIETLRLSKLLSQEGANIDGLAEVAAMEQSKRLKMKQKIKEFKSDIEGKIEFLNNVHKNLLLQFEEHKKDIQSEFVSANNALEQKVGSYFLDLNNKFSKLLNETKDNLQQLQQVLKEEEDKKRNEFDGMKSEQICFFEEVKADISKVDERASLFEKEQSTVIENLLKQTKIYKAVSFSAIVISVAAVLFAILK